MKWFGIALVLVSAFVHADANQDAFNAGASFGKGSKQSAGSLKNADTVSGALPGYTSSPPQADWYGGVTGGDGGLAGKGQGALQGSAAGQAVIDAGTKNPAPVIDPNAPYITIGKNAESTADGVLNDTAQQCKETTVSKSTFEKFICERDVWIDEYISGMQLTDKPAEVNRLLRQNGELSDLRLGDLHMVKRAEVMNFLIHGTIGVGKSTLIRWLLDYIRRRGDRAIIYDSGCTFTETHYNPQTDFILNAHDERCANWQMWGECIDTVDYENLAASLIPVEGDSDPFWVSSSRTIFSDLAIRMSADPERSIEKFLMTLLSLSMKSLREYLANTPSANLVEEKIEKTAISIRSVVTNYAKALRYLQGLDDGTKPPFTIREWMTSGRYDNSWLFISTQARHRKSVRPLISMWLSMTTLLLQSMGENSERRVWFIIDEKTSLQRIPEFAETVRSVNSSSVKV